MRACARANEVVEGLGSEHVLHLPQAFALPDPARFTIPYKPHIP